MNPKLGEQRITMGVNFDGSAWVRHGDTRYTVTYPAKHEVHREDGEITAIEGPDTLDHDEVLFWAHDARLDAYGAL